MPTARAALVCLRAGACVVLALLLQTSQMHGAHALAAGTFTFALQGRASCKSRGYWSAPGCDASSSRTTLTPNVSPTGLQWWTVTAVDGGSNIQGVPVLLQAAGRPGCAPFATISTCSDGRVVLAHRANDTQHWLLKQQGNGTFHIVPVLCPWRLLSLSNDCSLSWAALYLHAGGLNDWNATRLAPGPASVGVMALKAQVWEGGYEGEIRILNANLYPILNWVLRFKFEGRFSTETLAPQASEALNWIGEYSLLRNGSAVTIKPTRPWLKRIEAGALLRIAFDTSSALPRGFVFRQLLPPLDPDSDPALQARGTFGAKVFLPYFDATLNTPSLGTVMQKTGQRFFTLAFIIAKGQVPAWGGYYVMEDWYMYEQIRQVRLSHGDVAVSFGGANGHELAQAITDVQKLAAAYQAVIDQYKLAWVDFDIEGAAVADTPSVTRRNQAIKILQDNNPGLVVSYCLPVLPGGLTHDGIALLENAVQHGVLVDVVQVMAMDYGDSAAPDPDGQMGKYAISAARQTRMQAIKAGLNPQMGIIPMIGKNDVPSETFYLSDACKVVNFSATTPWVRASSFWSVGRDNYKESEKNQAVTTSSGIPQARFAFTKLFRAQACTP